MGKPSLTTDRSCSGALSRHIVHRVAMHVPWQKRHFDAVVPKMAKQNFAFPASTRTMFLNWKVKPTAIHQERVRHAKKVQPHWFPTINTQCQQGGIVSCRPGLGGAGTCDENMYCQECRRVGITTPHPYYRCVFGGD